MEDDLNFLKMEDTSFFLDGIDLSYCLNEVPSQYLYNFIFIFIIRSPVKKLNNLLDPSEINLSSIYEDDLNFLIDARLTQFSNTNLA